MNIAITTKTGDVFVSHTEMSFMVTLLDKLNSAKDEDFVDFGTVILRAGDVLSVSKIEKEDREKHEPV